MLNVYFVVEWIEKDFAGRGLNANYEDFDVYVDYVVTS